MFARYIGMAGFLGYFLTSEFRRSTAAKNQVAKETNKAIHLSSTDASLTKSEIKNASLSQDEKIASYVIQQAFRDVGVSLPLTIIFKKSKKPLKVTRAATMTNIANFKMNASILFYLAPTELNDLNRLYAIAGHEAIHILHQNSLIQETAVALSFGGTFYALATLIGLAFNAREEFSSQPFTFLLKAGLYLLNAGFWLTVTKSLKTKLIPQLSRIFEKDADISSALKLGTKNELIKVFLDSYPYLKRPHYYSFIKKNINHSNEVNANLLTEALDKDWNLTTSDIIRFFESNPPIKKTANEDTHPTGETRILYLSKLSNTSSNFFKQKILDQLESETYFLETKGLSLI